MKGLHQPWLKRLDGLSDMSLLVFPIPVPFEAYHCRPNDFQNGHAVFCWKSSFVRFFGALRIFLLFVKFFNISFLDVFFSRTERPLLIFWVFWCAGKIFPSFQVRRDPFPTGNGLSRRVLMNLYGLDTFGHIDGLIYL